MKIARASDVLQPYVRTEIATALASGDTVSIPAVAEHELGALQNAELPLATGTMQVARLSPQTQQLLAEATPGLSLEQRALIGIGSGSAVGIGVGMLLDQLRAVAPRSSLALSVACGLIGGALGGGVATGVFDVDVYKSDDGFGIKLKKTKP